jgi:predicted lysophospholipase L1 biosynthesis ABC-type transport system permease subunit
VTAAAETAGEATRIAEEARRILRERHGLDDPGRAKSLPRAPGAFAMRSTGLVPDDFTIRTEAARALTEGLYTPAAAMVLASMPRLDAVTSEEMVPTLARANATMTLLLASIASVSLVVGGIGIMNVMLLSVTERTREVGLRLSVGARTRDVLFQFLLEAVALSLAGGALGILFGFASAYAVTEILEWPTSVSPGAVALAFGLAFAVGVVFGYYPAYRASRLDPIDALRFE